MWICLYSLFGWLDFMIAISLEFPWMSIFLSVLLFFISLPQTNAVSTWNSSNTMASITLDAFLDHSSGKSCFSATLDIATRYNSYRAVYFKNLYSNMKVTSFSLYSWKSWLFLSGLTAKFISLAAVRSRAPRRSHLLMNHYGLPKWESLTLVRQTCINIVAALWLG